ncbi:MAG: hypothetical protein GY938_30750 [Ketobacter sp.]|nr:hypothetical protein [Ketobacter sp.]
MNWTPELIQRCADVHSQPTKPERWERIKQLGLDSQTYRCYRTQIAHPTARRHRRGKEQIRRDLLATQGGRCNGCGTPLAHEDRLCLTPAGYVVCGSCLALQSSTGHRTE